MIVPHARRAQAARVLSGRDATAARRILAADPVANVMVAARVEQSGLDPWRLGAEMWGHPGSGDLSALCFSGANLVPIGADAEALAAFADRARRQGRRCSSIVGEADQVLGLWELLSSTWGTPRDIRHQQPLMEIRTAPAAPPHPDVRLVLGDEIDLFLPAAVEMYTEEIGFSPISSDGGGLYRARVAELIALKHAFALVVDGKVQFKAEIGAVAGDVCQIQGVWVDPAVRGRGLGVTGTAAVVAAAQRAIAPIVSLYVNVHNEPARRAYERVGFRTVGEFASVLF